VIMGKGSRVSSDDGLKARLEAIIRADVLRRTCCTEKGINKEAAKE